MKLPEFRTAQDMTSASRSASMKEAFIEAQRRPNIKQAIAPQHSLTAGQQDPNAARKNVLAKYDVAQELVSGVGEVIKVFDAIDDGDQKMASAAAASEYSRRMADFQADELANAEQVIDEKTDTKRWEKYDDRYKEESERVLSDVRSRYKFNKKQHEFNFNQKVLGSDQTYTTNLTSQANRSKIARGATNYEKALNETEGTQAKIELTKEAYNSGYITEYQQNKRIYQFRSKDIYDAYSSNVDRQGNDGLLNIIKDVEDGSSKNASRLTTAQRNEIATDARRKIKSNSFFAMGELYEVGGIRAVAEYIDKANLAGPDGTFTEDEVGHASLIASLNARMNQYISIERANEVKNADAANIQLLGRNLTDDDINRYNANLTSKEKTRLDKEYMPVVAEIPDEVFYSPDREQYVPVVNSAKIGYLMPSVKRRVLGDLNKTDNQESVLQAANFIREMHVAFPDAGGQFGVEAITKANYMVDAQRNGRPLLTADNTGAVDDWETIRKQTPEQKRELRDRSAAYLSANPDIVAKLAEEFKAVDRDIWFKDVPKDSDVFNQRFSANYHNYYQATNGNEKVAGELAMRASMRVFGATTRYGNPVWEEDSPEAKLNEGRPSRWLDKQFNVQLEELNDRRSEAKLSRLDKNEVRLEFKEGNIWAIVTPDGEYVTDGNSRQGMEFLKVDPEIQQERNTGLHNDNVSQSNARVNAMIADASIELAQPTYGAVPNATVEMQSNANRTLWEMASAEQKTAENVNYRLAYDQLALLEIDDLSIRYYLNANGYVHGDEDNDYVGVPDASGQP